MKNSFTSMLLAMLLCSATVFSLPKLSSYPTASATIFLDFDGHTVNSAYWNGGNTIFASPATLTDAQITEIFNRVSEDYRPFNVNVTTDSSKFLSAPLTRRIRIIVTPTSAWRPGVGGIAYIGSFTWGDDTPAFVFSDRLGPNSPKYIGECCSHESGHAVGLAHQSSYDATCNLTATYNAGTGTGEVSWAPIMGNSYYRNMTGWNNGPTPYGCNNIQDNLTIITTQNGFSYRADDFSDTLNSETYKLGNGSFTLDGLIATNSDKDAFTFTIGSSGNFHVDAVPFSVGDNIGANLDVKVSLYDASNTLIRTYDPSVTMSVSIDTVLNAGVYYLLIDGTGNSSTEAYGSIGSYRLTGITSTLPIRSVTLTGNILRNRHNLNWTILSDDAIASQTLEVSDDAVNFKPFTTVGANATSFGYLPYTSVVLYYRIKVRSVLEQTVYSNIISLRPTSNRPQQAFTVSTFVQNDMSINASEDFRYRLLDANGRLISTGTGLRGFNRISMANRTAGLYVIQIAGRTQQQVERIIKE